MKRLLLLVFLSAQVLSIGDANAQEATVAGLNTESFSGVRSANNGEQYYIAFMDANAQDSANVVLKTFDRGMQPRLDVNIPVAKGTQLATYTFQGHFYVIQLVNVGNKTRSTLVVDETGNILRRKDESDIKASVLSPSSFPTLYPITPNEYLAVYTSRNGQPGIAMELMDIEMNSRWQKTLESQDAPEVLETKQEIDRLYFLKREKTKGQNAYSIQSVNGMSGDVVYDTEIREGDNRAIPGFFNVEYGFIITGGVFRKESAAGKPEGLFFARLNPTGMVEKMHFIPWSIIKTQVQNPVISEIENGKAGVLMQNAIADASGDGYTLIGELYKKTAGADANAATFSVQDFLLFHVTKEGQVDKISQFSKPAEDLLIKGAMSAKTDEELAHWLDKNRFFAYRAVVPMAGRNTIAYLNNSNGKAIGYFATIDSSGSVTKENIVAMPFDRGQKAETGSNKRENETASTTATELNSTENDLRNFAAVRSARDIVLSHEGHVLIYNYTKPDLQFWIMPIPQRQ